MTTETFGVVPGPMYRPSQLALAKAHPTVEDAVAVMGDGMVLGGSARLVAFHERHLPMIERLAGVRS